MKERIIIHGSPSRPSITMYRGLVTSGVILVVFGGFLVVLDFIVPLGVSVFGLPIAIVGSAMVAVGFMRSEPSSPAPQPGKKFCWYCMSQIAKDAGECPDCSLPQHDAGD